MLTAREGCCEEASVLSRGEYIPCNAPATKIVKTKDPQSYRMCDSCADHNVRNRGAELVGPFVASAADPEASLFVKSPAPAGKVAEMDVLDMAAADAGHEDSDAESSMGKLSNMLSLLRDAKADVTSAEEALADAKGALHELEQRRIPDLMRELRIKKTVMDDGSVVTLKGDASVSIPADRREEAYDWAEEQGHSGIVKTVVSVPFGKGEHDDALELIKNMAKITNREVDLARSIHASTLKAFVKGVLEDVAELKADGKKIPPELSLPEHLFTVFEYFKVDVKAPKKK